MCLLIINQQQLTFFYDRNCLFAFFPAVEHSDSTTAHNKFANHFNRCKNVLVAEYRSRHCSKLTLYVTVIGSVADQSPGRHFPGGGISRKIFGTFLKKIEYILMTFVVRYLTVLLLLFTSNLFQNFQKNML